MADLNIATLSSDYAVISEAALREFRGSLHGESLLPGDAGYDGARRIWNAMIDKRPALIARCGGTADVINSVNFARENNLLISVRGGGHNFPGNSVYNDGLMIDLSRMTGVRVDPVARTVRAQGGTKWGAFDHETQAFGLAAPGGTDLDTGIAGLTLGGGIGWLSGSYGLSCDNLVSADVVTADGHSLTASADENPDLFWALRGGGGNFGVATSLEYRLHPVGPKVLAGFLVYPFDKVREFLALVGEVTANMPDEMNLIAFLTTLPDGGGKACTILLCHHGPVEEGERAIRPLREFGPPLIDDVRPMSYSEAQTLALAPPGPAELPEVPFHEAGQRRRGGHHARLLRQGDLSALGHLLPVSRQRHPPRARRRDRLRPPGRPLRVGCEFGLYGPGGVGDPRPLGPGVRLSTLALLVGGLRQSGWHRGGGRGGGDTGGLRRQLPETGKPEAEVRPDKPVQPQPEHPAQGLDPRSSCADVSRT